MKRKDYPGIPDYINVKVEVMTSRQLVKNVMYDTSAKFVKIDDEHKDYIRKIVDYNLKKKRKRVML